ncbi:MAG: hypothetical protein NXH97_10230 [Rhodobacteraceae bacterium]|nr:hypothetical protein [Paracoccaceae bacterium]
MPLDRFVLILVVVIVAAALTVGVAVWAAAAFQLPAVALAAAAPGLLLAYVAWRVIADRLGNAEDDYYDRTPR